MRQRRERSRYRWLVRKFLLRATKTQSHWALLRMYMKSGSELSHSRTRKLKYLSTNFHLWFWGASQVINSLNSFGVLMRFREHNRATSRIRKALLHCLTVIETKVITVNLFFFFPSTVGHVDSSRGSVVKNLPANAGNTKDMGLIPGLGRSPGEGNDNLL